jgi:hypothetical protein
MVVPMNFTDEAIPTRANAKKPRNRAKEKRALEAIEHDVEFIAIDGEGETQIYYEAWDDEEGAIVTKMHNEANKDERIEVQDYVLLSVGDQQLHNNGKRLHYRQIFEFLYDQYLEHPKAAFVGFSLGYDFTQWFRSINRASMVKLLTKEGIAHRTPTESANVYPWPVIDSYRFWDDDTGPEGEWRVGKWAFDILGNKRFKLRPHVPKKDWPECEVNHKTIDAVEECLTGAHKKHPYNWMYICDVFPFFQSSFLKVIDPGGAPEDSPNRLVSDADWTTLVEGKSKRSTAVFGQEMMEYNALENKVLANVMRKMNQGFVADGIRMTVKQWMGPGQAAQIWMSNIGVPTGEEIRECTPKYALDAAKASYYGGWFEIFSHGPIPGTSYAYDINSAYPNVIANLPCLLHGSWCRGTAGDMRKLSDDKMRLLQVTVVGKDKTVGPTPFRAPNGNILRPLHVKGWYWQHELEASKRAGLIKTVKVHRWVEYTKPECECKHPMSKIKELYFGRIDPSKGKGFKNSPQGKAKKLVYNSAYGKLAQSIGMPRFSNSVYASLITAGCRTMILDAIATHPTKTKSLLMIATDGIVFKEPHPNLPISPTELGLWDEETYENLSLFMPGLYWHDKAREQIKAGQAPQLKSRGVNPKYLGTMIDRIDDRWRAMLNGDTQDYPMEFINIDWAIIGAKQAIVSGDWSKCARVVRNQKRKVSGWPGNKRNHGWWSDDAWGGLRSTAYEYYVSPSNIPSMGIKQGDKIVQSLPYEPTFGDDRLEEDEIGMLLTRDGYIGDLQAHAFGLR